MGFIEVNTDANESGPANKLYQWGRDWSDSITY